LQQNLNNISSLIQIQIFLAMYLKMERNCQNILFFVKLIMNGL
jgi:hypothetical protein